MVLAILRRVEDRTEKCFHNELLWDIKQVAGKVQILLRVAGAVAGGARRDRAPRPSSTGHGSNLSRPGHRSQGKRPSISQLVSVRPKVEVHPPLSSHAVRVSGSSALRAEAKETRAWSSFSLPLLLGLVANAQAGWCRADPIAALFMTPWLVKEWIEGVPDRSNKPYCFPMALDHS
jgi:hypothetical protein